MPNVDMSLMRLEAMHASSGGFKQSSASKYAQSGMSQARIKAVLASPGCECGCQMPSKLLIRVCRAFWLLPKQSQDALLWSIQLEGGRASRRTWSIAGAMALPDSFEVLKVMEFSDAVLCTRPLHVPGGMVLDDGDRQDETGQMQTYIARQGFSFHWWEGRCLDLMFMRFLSDSVFFQGSSLRTTCSSSTQDDLGAELLHIHVLDSGREDDDIVSQRI